MFDAPFDRGRIYREQPGRSMQMKIADYETRRLQALSEPLYEALFDDEDVETEEDVGEFEMGKEDWDEEWDEELLMHALNL